MYDEDETEAEQAPADLDGLSRKLIGWVKQDMEHVLAWRKEAREDYAFRNLEQWSDEDKRFMASFDPPRPMITWDRIAPLVNAIVGSEINNRREVRYFPRETGDSLPNQMLSEAGEWFRDECNAEDEESDAFEDTVVCGMGWTDTTLDFESNPNGEPVIERMDSLEMGWDCYTAKPNLEDARRLWRIREMSYEDAEELTGVDDKTRLHASWAKGFDDEGEEPHDQQLADEYRSEEDGSGEYPMNKKCVLVEVRWTEREDYFRGPSLENPDKEGEYEDEQVVRDKATGGYFLAELPQWALEQGIPAVKAFKARRKIVRRAFVGKDVLGEVDEPLVPPGKGLFGWECITGYRDKQKRHFYGVVRAAKDPQRWSNKFLSQVMFILNSQSKGGVMYEKDAVENPDEFEDSWAQSDTATVVRPGAITAGKIMPKPVAQFPAGFFTLFQESKESINDVTGLSQEFLGTREVDQAGVLEYQRRQSSLNILASLFNSLRRYRKRQGRVLLYLIQEHLSDGRLIRIAGEENAKYVQLTRDEVADKDYDIIIDDSPSSPNEKERTWQILMQLLPLVKDLLDVQDIVGLLEISPLPATMVEKIRQGYQRKMEEAQNQPDPEQQAMEQEMQMAQQTHQMDMEGKQADNQGKMIDLQVKQAGAALDAQTSQQKAQAETQKAGIDLFIEQQMAALKMLQEERKHEVAMQGLAVKERQNEIAQQRANTQRIGAAKG